MRPPELLSAALYGAAFAGAFDQRLIQHKECPAVFNATLTVAIEKHFPFYVPHEESVKGTQGVDVLLLHTLKSALGFRLRLVRPPDAKWGSLQNGSWNGMIGMLVRKEADMAAGGMSMLADRHAWVLFSSPYLLDRTTFVVRAPRKVPRSAVILRPFSWRVWAVLLSTLAVVSLLPVMRNVLQSRGRHCRDPPAASCPVTLENIFRVLLGQGVHAVPSSWRRRLLLGVWMLFGQVLSMGYSGNLISYMTEPGREPAVDTIAKLSAEVRRGHFACGTIRDAAEHALIRSDNSSVARLLLRSMESDRRNFVRGDIEGLQECLHRDYAYIAAEITVDADIKEPQWFLFARDSFRVESYALAFPKGFRCLEPFNQKITQLQAAGLVTLWLHHTVFRARHRSHREEPRVHPLQVAHLQGIFLLSGACLAVASLVALVEVTGSTERKCRLRRKRRRRGVHSMASP